VRKVAAVVRHAALVEDGRVRHCYCRIGGGRCRARVVNTQQAREIGFELAQQAVLLAAVLHVVTLVRCEIFREVAACWLHAVHFVPEAGGV
jgi:hypothetical protein